MLNSVLCVLLLSSASGIMMRNLQKSAKNVQNVNRDSVCEGVEPKALCLSGLGSWGFVWLHGLGNGATSKYYQNILVPQILALSQPGLRVFPQAPEAFVQSDNVTEQSWHGQETKTCDVNYKPPHHGYSLEDGLNNVPIVHRGIDQLIAAGIPANRIIVAGHSQGGSMVYLSAMKYQKSLLAAINLSGGLLGWWQTNSMVHPANKGLPMLWVKGDKDEIVPQAHQDEIRPVVEKAGFPLETSFFKGGHDLTMEVIPDVSNFINRHLMGFSGTHHTQKQ